MRHFVLQRCVRLALYATLAHAALACGADTDRSPPIGSPPGPIGPVISEAGSPNAGGQAGNAPNTGGPNKGIDGGAFNTGSSGSNTIGTAGNGSAGREPFGAGGSPASAAFGIGGAPTAASGSSFF